MQKVFDELTTAFRKHDGVLNEEQYKHCLLYTSPSPRDS